MSSGKLNETFSLIFIQMLLARSRFPCMRNGILKCLLMNWISSLISYFYGHYNFSYDPLFGSCKLLIYLTSENIAMQHELHTHKHIYILGRSTWCSLVQFFHWAEILFISHRTTLGGRFQRWLTMNERTHLNTLRALCQSMCACVSVCICCTAFHFVQTHFYANFH